MTNIRICNTTNEDIINERMYMRNVPSNKLQSCYSTRPVPTKYTKLPIINHKQNTTIPLDNIPYFNIKQTFNPGNAQAPFSNFATNVNTESMLRNQIFALANCDKSTYVPGTNSDLYNKQIIQDNPNIIQKFPYLFKTQNFPIFNPNQCNLGNNFFDNNTRIDRLNLKL